MAEFHVPTPTTLLGVSLFVAGFAIGPLIWAPMSEMYGRQIPFIITYGILVVWNGAAAGSTSMRQLAVFRFLTGAFGSSPLTNAGGVIADIFSTEERGLAIGLFSVEPFMGPVMGPIVGGFLAESAGWRWVLWLVTLLCGIVFLAVTLSTPETYGPHLLRQRAIALTSLTGKHHVSSVEKTKGRPTLLQALKTGFSRPWQLLFLEPIVLIMAVYMAINFGTMFMIFAAYPIIFQQGRGWSVGTNGLTFIGILIGMLIAFGYLFAENRRYMQKLATQTPGTILPPEARLPPCMVGAIACPIGLFWFAWTNGPNLHWIICLVGTVPFGFGTVLLTTSGMNYLIDAYVVYAASAIAGVTVMRSVAGCAFPLSTRSMYEKLGLHWASSVPAFAALLCVPLFVLQMGPSYQEEVCVCDGGSAGARAAEGYKMNLEEYDSSNTIEARRLIIEKV